MAKSSGSHLGYISVVLTSCLLSLPAALLAARAEFKSAISRLTIVCIQPLC